MILELYNRRVLIAVAVVLGKYGKGFFPSVVGDEPTW
jgi:hypothetical protein